MSDRVDALRTDIAAGPQALARLADAYASADSPAAGLTTRIEGRRLVFVGLGSSRYAALTAASARRARGGSAWVEHASATNPTAPARDLVVVAISASGRTSEVVERARRHRGTSLVIAVTNDEGSALAREADVVLPLLAGVETAGISTLTFRATVAVLGLLLGSLRPDRLRTAVDRLASVAETRDPALQAAVDLLDGAPLIDVLADAGAMGTAEQAALMLREAPRLPAHAGETGEWLHTSVYLAVPGHRALVFAGSAADAEVVATIGRRGGETIAVGAAIEGARHTIGTDRRADDGPFVRAILESVVADRLAADLWERTAATG